MMLLSEAAAALGARLLGDDVAFTSVGTDSRQITPGQLFVALKGDNFDGHDFAAQAIAQGAAAVLLSSPVAAATPALLVADTCQAMGQLAAYWRSKFNLPLAAITGSNGKTTVKEMLASILKAASGNAEAVLATAGNFNNHIGLPLTLFKLDADKQYAVIEMGMNHSGEISYLTGIAKPTLALINNAGNAHLGELGSFEAIAQAKGEIFSGLTVDGVAIINADDVFAPLWLDLVQAPNADGIATKRRTLKFGLKNAADVSASYQLKASTSELAMITPAGSLNVTLPTPGLHNVMNALAATTAAIGLGVPLAAIKAGLETFSGAKGRLQHVRGQNGALVIDDTYNANPMSMKAAIDVLAARSGDKLLVLGDMGELGADALEMHAEVGRYAKSAGIKALFTLGDMSAEMGRAFGAGAKHYTTPQALSSELLAQLTADTTVLVKGSRFMAMERVVQALLPDQATNYIKGAH